MLFLSPVDFIMLKQEKVPGSPCFSCYREWKAG